MLLKSELKTLVLTLSRDGNKYFTVLELTENSLLKLQNSGNSIFQIIDSFLFSGARAISDGIFKDFKLQIWNGIHWYEIKHSKGVRLSDATQNDDNKSTEFNKVRDMYLSLTKVESKLLRLSSQGMDEEAISKHLNVTLNTVKSHRKQVYKKLGFRNKGELILWSERYLIQL